MSEFNQNPLQLRRINVKTERQVAYESPDHLVPWGTRRDNSRQRRFNQKLYQLFGEERPPLWILDLGCSGGGFVKDCLDDGCMAVGIEGSDFSKRMRRAEWRSIPEHLFTADITAPFDISGEFPEGEQRLQFDVITTWEVMEHIREVDLAAVAENIKKHLRPGGLWIMSIALCDDIRNGVNLHQTVKPPIWWKQKFEGLGLQCAENYVHYFNTQFLRGPKEFWRKPKGVSLAGFHLVVTNDITRVPSIPKEPWFVRLYDKWLGSRPQRLLKLAIYGV